MMVKKCSKFHRCTQRGLNFLETVYELLINPSTLVCMTFYGFYLYLLCVLETVCVDVVGVWVATYSDFVISVSSHYKFVFLCCQLEVKKRIVILNWKEKTDENVIYQYNNNIYLISRTTDIKIPSSYSLYY